MTAWLAGNAPTSYRRSARPAPARSAGSCTKTVPNSPHGDWDVITGQDKERAGEASRRRDTIGTMSHYSRALKAVIDAPPDNDDAQRWE